MKRCLICRTTGAQGVVPMCGACGRSYDAATARDYTAAGRAHQVGDEEESLGGTTGQETNT